MESLSFTTLSAGLLVGVAASLVGSLLLLRKLTLVSDSLPHIALPGIALGVVMGFNPILGAFAFLLFAVALVWLLEYKTKLEVESVIGVLFVTALAVGSSLVEGEELLESFFGNIASVSQTEGIVLSLLALVITVVTLSLQRRLVLHSIAPELERGHGVNSSVTEIIFLVLVASVVAAGIKFVGVFLMSSLLIIPSVTARLIAGESLRKYQMISVVVGIISIVSGMLLPSIVGIETGTLTVLTGALLFAVALMASLFKKN